MPSYQRLQLYAIAISIASIFYNGAEGGISIGLGSESDSHSLIFFGIQSGIEVAASVIVVWRFRHIAKPGEEVVHAISNRDLRIEKAGSWGIGLLLFALAIATEAAAIVGLAQHREPDSSNAALIISASALVIMVLIWLPKNYLARALNSSTMQGEATCSLSCIQITIVLFVGALVFRLWKGGWWVDSATSLVLGLMFGWEGWKLIRWVRDPEFNGGCCKTCKTTPALEVDAELGERYRDLCGCCYEKGDCRDAGKCTCDEKSVDGSTKCCTPVDSDGAKCCTHELKQGQKPIVKAKDTCCSGGRCSEDDLCKEKEDVGDTCCARDIPHDPIQPAGKPTTSCCGSGSCAGTPKAASPAVSVVPVATKSSKATASVVLASNEPSKPPPGTVAVVRPAAAEEGKSCACCAPKSKGGNEGDQSIQTMPKEAKRREDEGVDECHDECCDD